MAPVRRSDRLVRGRCGVRRSNERRPTRAPRGNYLSLTRTLQLSLTRLHYSHSKQLSPSPFNVLHHVHRPPPPLRPPHRHARLLLHVSPTRNLSRSCSWPDLLLTNALTVVVRTCSSEAKQQADGLPFNRWYKFESIEVAQEFARRCAFGPVEKQLAVDPVKI